VSAAYTAYCTVAGTSMVDTLQAGVNVDSLQTGWAFYKIGLYTVPWTGLGAAYARNAVRTERRLELAMEGQRFFDLRRWAIADTASTATSRVRPRESHILPVRRVSSSCRSICSIRFLPCRLS